MELIIIRNMKKHFVIIYCRVNFYNGNFMSWVGIVPNKYCDKFSCKSN